MTGFLTKLFIRNSEDIHDPQVRQRYGMMSGGVGIAANLILFLGKLFAGWLSGSIAVVADAFNNLSDAGSSVVTLIGFKMAGQKADKDHPFGHGRIEYLAGLIVALAILLVGLELLKSSVDKILHPSPVDFTVLSAVILVAAVLVKFWMHLFNKTLGKKISSPAMAATAADSLSDAVATTAVLVCMLIGHFTNLQIDGWAGILVAVFILYSGIGAARDTLNPLLGQPPDGTLVKEIEETVLAHREIMGIHDMVIHDYGPGRSMVSLHAEVPADADILYIHDTIDAIERELKRKYSFDAVIHMDPIDTDDERVEVLRSQVLKLVQEIQPDMTIHDFRITAGPQHTNLIFDIVVPYESKLTEEEVRKKVREKIKSLGDNYFAVIQVDHSYV